MRSTTALGPGVRVAFTDRTGGVSAPPYDELNLGPHVGDEPRHVATNGERLAADIGRPVGAFAWMAQVHGRTVAVVDGPVTDPVPDVDALVTAAPGVVLGVLVADCAPVLMADPVAGVVAAAHAGRRGLQLGVVPATVEAMAGLGAELARVEAVIGPCICLEHYEVPASMRAEVADAAPGSAATTAAGAPSVDLRAGLEAQLAAAGVRSCRSEVACTYEDPALFSYRRDGVTGRFAGLVWLEWPA